MCKFSPANLFNYCKIMKSSLGLLLLVVWSVSAAADTMKVKFNLANLDGKKGEKGSFVMVRRNDQQNNK